MSRLHAAAAQVKLRPTVGAPLTGFATRLEPSTGSHDPLLARLLILDDGSARLVWLSCDLIGFSRSDAAALRHLIADQLAMSPDNVLVSCTHTHSGPSSMPFRGNLARVDRPWLADTFASITHAAVDLPHHLRPARLACATETVPGLGYNRQDPLTPIDERLLVAQFTDDNGLPIATLLNYSTHPVVLGERNLLFSADYPGCATGAIEQSLGGVALFILGSAGDVDPAIYRDQGRHAGTFATAEQMGRELAAAASRALSRARRCPDVRISILGRHVDLPLDPPPSGEEVARLQKELLARRGSADSVPSSNEGRWSIFELAWADELRQAMERNAVPTKVQVQLVGLGIGNLYILAFPFELYSQIGLDIRRELDPHPVLIAGYTNGLIGYVPTDRAREQGGYGPSSSHRFFPELLTAVGRGAEGTLVRTGTDLLRSLPGQG